MLESRNVIVPSLTDSIDNSKFIVAISWLIVRYNVQIYTCDNLFGQHFGEEIWMDNDDSLPYIPVKVQAL